MRHFRALLLFAVAGVAAASAFAQDWSNLATVSMTNATSPKLTNRFVCYTDGRDIRCDSPSLYVTTGGLVGIDTTNPTTQLEVNGTVSATNFVGDGSSLTGISTQGDRIVSGTAPFTQMIAISNTRYISITQGGANTGWFDPTRGLVTLGVSATGPISGTDGYFSGKVGIGTGVVAPLWPIHVSGTFPIIMLDHAASGASNAAFHFAENGASRWAISNLNGAYASIPSLQNALTFYQVSNKSGTTLNSYRMVITDSGNVGISTTSPLAKLDVVGTISLTDALQLGQNTIACGTVVSGSIRYNTTSNTVQFCDGTGWVSLASGTTAGGSALGDRIVSGTTNIIAWEDRSLTFTTAGSQRMVVAQGGNVGIGTAIPGRALEVSGSFTVSNSAQAATAPSLFVHSGGMVGVGNTSPTVMFTVGSGGDSPTPVSGRLAMFTNNGITNVAIRDSNADAELLNYISSIGGFLGTVTDHSLTLRTNNTDRLHITNTGNVGIGTTSPAAKLDVAGTISASSALQVGTASSLTCTSGISGSIRYSQVSSTMEYCNSTAWVSMGPSDTIPVGFNVNKNGTNQTGVTQSTFTLMTWVTMTNAVLSTTPTTVRRPWVMQVLTPTAASCLSLELLAQPATPTWPAAPARFSSMPTTNWAAIPPTSSGITPTNAWVSALAAPPPSWISPARPAATAKSGATRA